MTARVKISQNVDILAKVYLVHLTLLWLQGSKISQNVDILQGISSALNPPVTARVQHQSKCWYTCQGISSALNPPVTARVKISQNVDILAKVYLVHLKVEHCQTLVYMHRSKWVNRFWLVKALSGIVQGGQNDSKNQSKMPPCAHLHKQSKHADFDLYSYLPLKCNYSRRVNLWEKCEKSVRKVWKSIHKFYRKHMEPSGNFLINVHSFCFLWNFSERHFRLNKCLFKVHR